jgi:hypothetical protein
MRAGEAFQLVHEAGAEPTASSCSSDEEAFHLSNSLQQEPQAGATQDLATFTGHEDYAERRGWVVVGVLAQCRVDLLIGP